MKKFSTKSTLLFAAAMAVCAFAMPSMASAASWGVIGTEHTLHSPNYGYINHASAVTSSCTNSTFTVDVASSANLEITTANFRDCTTSGPAVGDCRTTTVATNLPWTATAVTTSNIQIHGIRIDVFLEDLPTGNTCSADGINLLVTGTTTLGRWTGNGAGQHSMDLNGGPGLSQHSALGNGTPQTVNGLIRDTQQTLVIN
jgi:hypothetical protein